MKLSLEQRVAVGFIVALVTLGGISTASFYTNRQLVNATDAAWRTQESLIQLASLLSTMTDVETGARGYAITGDESVLEPYNKALPQVGSKVEQLRALIRDPTQQRRLEALVPLLAERLALTRELIDQPHTPGFVTPQEETLVRKGKQAHDQIRRAIGEMELREIELRDRRERETRTSARIVRNLIMFGGVASFLWIGVAVVTIQRDLAARRQLQDALAEASMRNEITLASVADGIHGVDLQGRIVFENRASEHMLGWPAGELLDKPAHVTIHHTRADGSPYPVEDCPIYACFSNGTACDVADEVFWRKDGTSFPVEYTVAPMHGPRGEIVGATVAFRDLSKRLREEAELRALIESAPNGILMVTPAGSITLVNVQVERLFGYARSELLGQCIELLVPERIRAQHLEYRTALFADPQARAMGAGRDVFGRRRDGSEFPVEIGLSPIRTHEGTSFLAVVVDISERKRAETDLLEINRQLLVATEQAQVADRAKSAFLAMMSHELRTPLNSIIGFTGILLQGLAGPLNLEQSKQLEMVRGSGRHLLALINDVLDISKIEAGQLEVASARFDLPASIMKVAGAIRPLAEKKGLGLRLRVEVSPDLGEVVSDQRRVEQVLLNLLSNAIKFTERGEVALTAAVVSDFQASGESSTRPAVRLRVSDTGMGIKPEDLATLFQPFRQIDSGLSRAQEGTGLGLSICRRLADLMGGEIHANSEWGKGSVFTFTLPITRETRG